jgi:hypothetical protein
MIQSLRLMQTLALIMLCVMVIGVQAAEETITGTVQNVDTQQGRFRLSAEDGGLMELRAPAALLANLQVGDAVDVRLSGTRVIDISKRQHGQPPTTNGTQQLHPSNHRQQSR